MSSCIQTPRSASTTCFLLLATAIAGTSAHPFRRQVQDLTVTNYMETALQTFLSLHGVNNFHAEYPAWLPIDFAGSGSSSSSEMAMNGAFFGADQIFVPDPISYSQLMIDFIQQLNIDMNLNSTTSGINKPDVKQAAEASQTACYVGMTDALADVTKAYTDSQGDSGFRLPAGDCRICQSASNTYQAKLSEAVGKDFYIFSGALNAVAQITTQTTVIPGITMEVSTFPTLNGTLTSWQSPENAGIAPKFHWGGSSVTGSTTNTSSSGGGGVSFIWEDFSGSGSGGTTNTKSTTNTTAQGIDISFGQIGMFAVEYGLWNSPDVASALQSPSDAVAQKSAQAFKDYYGTAEKPGPLASWKDQALVVFQPSFSTQFATSQEAAEFHETSGSAGACFLFICVEAHGSSSTNTTSYVKGSQVVTFNDTSNQAYLVGFAESTYYENQGVQNVQNWNFTLNEPQDTDSSTTTPTNANSTGTTGDDNTSSTGEGDSTTTDGQSSSEGDDGASSGENDTTGDDSSSSEGDGETSGEESTITSGSSSSESDDGASSGVNETTTDGSSSSEGDRETRRRNLQKETAQSPAKKHLQPLTEHQLHLPVAPKPFKNLCPPPQSLVPPPPTSTTSRPSATPKISVKPGQSQPRTTSKPSSTSSAQKSTGTSKPKSPIIPPSKPTKPGKSGKVGRMVKAGIIKA
ncbi:hypothetical protein D9757_008232 [Collybiopsis confluens]|uniref:Uncharacterized protein n=1 Tax=Collybiopsis confluens TaxID=2823264 RepID=A0A8H5HBF7_9AGAR|nr:hypothetical protein D9757_008232 [Collybiopsis confluens]